MVVFVANREIRKRMYTLQAELKLEQTQRVNERHQRFKDAMFGVAVYWRFTQRDPAVAMIASLWATRKLASVLSSRHLIYEPTGRRLFCLLTVVRTPFHFSKRAAGEAAEFTRSGV
jgi:hypothetical protein